MIAMIIRETRARSILSRSKVYEYTINPYVGCQHACTYCYARFMKRFSGHKEPWGQFVDVKINAPDLLREEVKRKPAGRVWISGVCDPYQPIERKHELTKMCVEILIQHDWPINSWRVVHYSQGPYGTYCDTLLPATSSLGSLGLAHLKVPKSSTRGYPRSTPTPLDCVSCSPNRACVPPVDGGYLLLGTRCSPMDGWTRLNVAKTRTSLLDFQVTGCCLAARSRAYTVTQDPPHIHGCV